MPTPDITVEDPPPISSEQLLVELQKLVDHGVLTYVLPTTPLGEAWVLGTPGPTPGAPGGIVKLGGDAEAAAFLAGSSLTAMHVARRHGLM